jgi:hypothetical protein
MSRRFVKKPLEIEAFRFGLDDTPEWFTGDDVETVESVESRYDSYCLIRTLEGTMCGEIGDYIIKGIKSEIYPCKADIFEASYDEVLSDYAKTMIGLST